MKEKSAAISCVLIVSVAITAHPRTLRELVSDESKKRKQQDLACESEVRCENKTSAGRSLYRSPSWLFKEEFPIKLGALEGPAIVVLSLQGC